MQAFRAHRRLSSWIAALAILLASLAPSVSHALAPTRGTNWIEVCSTLGSKWMQAGQDESQRAPASAQMLDHCPYCSLDGSTLGLSTVKPLAQLPLPLWHKVPLAFLAAPRSLYAWVSAQPRAPPLFC